MQGEHTIIGEIPRERPSRIASRAPSAAGIPIRIAPDRETLEGGLVQEENVTHPQLDRERPPAAAPRRLPAAILVADLVPEASAY